MKFRDDLAVPLPLRADGADAVKVGPATTGTEDNQTATSCGCDLFQRAPVCNDSINPHPATAAPVSPQCAPTETDRDGPQIGEERRERHCRSAHGRRGFPLVVGSANPRDLGEILHVVRC